MDNSFSNINAILPLLLLGKDSPPWMFLLITLCLPALGVFLSRRVTPYFKRIQQWATSQPIEFQARLQLQSWAYEPDSIVRQFAFLLWDWNRKNETSNCRQFLEEATGENRWHEIQEDGNMVPFFVDNPHTPFWHKDRPSIQYTMWVDRFVDRDNISHGEIKLKITCVNKDATPQQLIDHLAYLRETSDTLKHERARRQVVLVSSPEEKKEEHGPTFMKYEFKSTSTFSNFFCEEARLVEADLDTFLTQKSVYERTGRPWTYTLLNEGPPGTGKTKLVKAIANHTGRTLIMLNLRHISNVQTLYEAFHSSVLGDDHIPHEKRLYYIPEVDTQKLEELKARPNEEETTKESAEESVKDTKNTKKIATASSLVDNAKPTLGEILNVLDGVPERYGHILVMDTNAVQRLDPALLRPGRVDRILSWQKLSSKSVKQLLEHTYEVTIPDTATLPDRLYSAAELQQQMAQHSQWYDIPHCESSLINQLEILASA